MKKLIALALVASTTIATALPSQAQTVTLNYGDRVRVVETYCDRHPRDRDCRGYRDGRWGRNDYNRFYDNRRGDLDSVAAGLFGLTLGAIVGGAIANSNNNRNGDRLVGPVGGGNVNVQACQARYRSYDVSTNTFLGYDGVRHPCNL
jgi:hypothetical protein